MCWSFGSSTAPRLVNSFRLPFKPRPAEKWTMGRPADIAEEKDRYLSGASVVYLRGDGCELAYERVSGELMWGLASNTQVLLRGPRLHVLKSDAPTGVDPAGWKFIKETHGDGAIRWDGRFGDDWTGGYDIRLDRDGTRSSGTASPTAAPTSGCGSSASSSICPSPSEDSSGSGGPSIRPIPRTTSDARAAVRWPTRRSPKRSPRGTAVRARRSCLGIE